MKTVHDLTQEELEELRESYFYQLEETDSEVLGDITEPEGIPIDNVKAHYEELMFVDEDFFCNNDIFDYQVIIYDNEENKSIQQTFTIESIDDVDNLVKDQMEISDSKYCEIYYDKYHNQGYDQLVVTLTF